MAKHLKEAKSRNGREEKDKNSSLALKKEDSTSVKDNEVESSQKAGEVGSESNVIIEQLAPPTPPSANLEPDEMFDEELQPTEGNNYKPSVTHITGIYNDAERSKDRILNFNFN